MTPTTQKIQSMRFRWMFFLALTFGMILQVSCQKSASSSAGAGGGVVGGTTTAEEEVELEVSGSIDPTDFVQAQDSVEIGGVNLTTAGKYSISAFYLSPLGKKVSVYQGTSDTERFSFKSKVPKRYLTIDVTRQSDGYRLGAFLPPALRSKLAKLRLNRTSSIAAKMANIIADKAAAGDEAALKALSTNSISVADTLIIAQSVARVITEQSAQNKGSSVDLAALTEELVEKSNDKISALQVEGQSAAVVAEKLSDKTYETVFSGEAEATSPGVLAYRTNHDLGTSTVAKRDVAYEAIIAVNSTTTKFIDAAFRVEADVIRSAENLSAAVTAQSSVSTTYSTKFSECYAGNSSCAPAGYIPPAPPSSSTGGSSGGGSTGSDPVATPVITINTHPANQTAAGGSATFTVAASVTFNSTLSYQWQKKESGSGLFVNMNAATSSSLSLSGLKNTDDNGDMYRVIVSASGGATNVTSSAATLTVNPCPANGWCAEEMTYYIGSVATSLDISGSGTWNAQTYTNGSLKAVITITSHPSNQTASNGSATFSVTATVTNGAILSYQWQRQESGSGSFNDISGETSSTLNLSSLTNPNDNGDSYRVVVSATGGAESFTSSSATLTVVNETPNYVISNSLGILNGQYSGAAESTAINGTWFYGGTYGGRGYWTRVVPGKGTGYIYFKNSYQYGSFWLIGPTLGGDPASYSSFWYRAYDENPTSPNNVPAYAWESGTGYDKVSPGLIFTLAGAVATPVITITAQPTSQTVTTGAIATLSVTASVTESAPAFYQWQKQEGGSGAFVAVSGATGSSLVLSNLTNSDDNGDVYRCVVSAPGGAQSVTSSSATLTVTTDVTDYLMAGSATAAVNGTWVYGGMYGTRRYWTRQVDGYGTGYIYFKAGHPIDGQYYPHWIIGPTLGGEPPTAWYRRNYETPNDSPAFPHNIPATGWEPGSMGYASTLTLTPVGITPVISITGQPSNQTASGGSATFSVTATVTQSATLSYQWQKQEGGSGSFSNVSGATSSSLVLSGLTSANDNGDVFQVIVSASGGATNVTSSAATLTVNPCPANGWCAEEMTYYIGSVATSLDISGSGTWNAQTYTSGSPKAVITITAQPSSQTASNGGASFSVVATVTNSATLSYQWQKQESGMGDYQNVDGATSASLSLSNLTNADDHGDVYRCVVSATGGATNVPSNSALLSIPGNGGGSSGVAPILLATFDENMILDSGPNNYWLDSSLDGYPDGGNVKTAWALQNHYSPYASSGSVQVGQVSGMLQSLGIRTDVGRASFASQVSGSPFTIEMWYYPGDALSTIPYYSGERYFKVGPYVVSGVKADEYNEQNGAPTYAYTAVYGIGWAQPGSELCLTPTLLTPQSWNHVALVVDTSEVRLYIGGALACTGPLTTNPWINEFQVGGFYGNEFSPSNEYSRADDVRVMPLAIYSGSTISPPAIGSLTYSRSTNATTELLLNATHGIEDWGKNKIALKYEDYFNSYVRSGSSPIVSSAEKKFGPASYFMDGFVSGLHLGDLTYGSGQTAAMASLTGALQNGPWTIEMWVRPTATLSYNATPNGDPEQSGEAYWTLGFAENNYIALYDNTYAGPKKGTFIDGEGNEYPNSWLVPDTISSGVTLEYRVGGVSQRVNLPTSLSRDAWHHLAVVADTAVGLLRLKVNGTQVGTIDISGSWASKGAGFAGIDGLAIGELSNHIAGQGGTSGNTCNWFTGYIDDIRISSAALYGTGNYAVPTAPLD